MNSRPLIQGGDTALTPLHNSDPNTLSLITLYGNTGQIGKLLFIVICIVFCCDNLNNSCTQLTKLIIMIVNKKSNTVEGRNR